MWAPTSPLQHRLVAALERDGVLAATDFTEAELLAEGDVLALSPLFGEYVELLLAQWHDLDCHADVTRTICNGLKKNPSRDALIHAIDVIVACGLEDLSAFARALDSRAADDESSLNIRVEAVSGLTQFALQSARLTTYAASGLLRLLDVDDDWVKAKLCRVASILHDQLAWPDALESLVTLSRCEACAVEARQELGFVEMANAFRCDDLPSMTSCFERSANWFAESARLAEDSPRARMYATIVSALAQAFTMEAPAANAIRSLNNDAQWVVHYESSREGGNWLSPPPEAELEWIPLLGSLHSTSFIDPFSLMASAIVLFEKVRSVRVGRKEGWEYCGPQGISKLTEKGRLVGSIRTWLLGNATTSMTREGRARLAASFAQIGASPGKH
jgi:hypothetical protein